ncbi:tonB protein [Asticcacaulis biprosthecium C19]|uniref:TonB protein n=1 Tax=Asticcacaulis biprosthecium C19 TaxID=715226 RepID=F4QS02_9CAUL|nr:energy transducer TonB [Asticcacaulis biprosthecium]EGF89522.1 tonB protein [Asticcacaulis biprosthecium C19]
MINQRFSVHVPEFAPSPPTTVTIERLPEKEVPPKPVKTTLPPQTTLNPRPVDAPIPDEVETTPMTPSDTPADTDGKTPPIPASEPTTGPATEPAPPGPVYVNAKWTRFPDSDALMSYYPSAAEDAEAVGTATVECTVVDTRGRVTCAIVSESPKGYGFGKATVTMVQKEGRVDTRQGDVRVGSKLRTTVRWTLE